MVAQTSSSLEEAKSLDLFKPHGAFEVHCANCHSRLNPMGDCSNCGLIGRPLAEIEKRMTLDPTGTEKVLREAVAKRRAYKPVKG
jgi:hypothetical protein